MRKPLVPVLIVLAIAGSITYLRFSPKPDARPETVKTDVSETKGEARPWAHQESDIAPDPDAVFGKLENGLRYMIRANAEPPGRVSLRMHIDAGSLMEDEDQRGVAHFLEHMVFNGSKNFTPDELIPQMQRLGISFGAHANAYTSFDETVYMLDLPNIEEDTLELAFTVMRDFADGALLKTEEIDKERNVILSEKTSRDSVQMRLQEQQFEFLMPDSLITHRFPIGTEEVISNAPRQRFVDFYTQYYTPARITFVAVGDIDPDEFEKRTVEAFSSLTNPSRPGPDPEMGTLPSDTGLRAAVFTDKEVGQDELSLVFMAPYTPVADTAAERASRLPLALAHAVMNRRFSILAKKEGSPISSGGTGRAVWFEEIEFGYADVTPVEGKWREALPVLEQEVRRALEFGFTPAEVAEAKANVLNAYQQAAKQAPTRRSDGRGGLATQFVNTLNSNQVFSTPATNLALVEDSLEGITAEDCHAAMSEFWGTEDVAITLTTKSASENVRDELLSLYKSSRATEVSPPVAEEVGTFAYTDFGEAGSVVADTTHEDLGIRQVTFSNGVRLNLKQTDFEKNSIRLRAQFGNGQLTQPKDQPGLVEFASAVVNGGGLGEHSIDELERILAGRNVGVGFGVAEDYFLLSGRTTPEDLELQLQLMAASLKDPGFREEAARQFRKAVPNMVAEIEHTLEGGFRHLTAWLRGDPRFAVPTEEQLLAHTVADVQAWLDDSFANGYLEVSAVGDFEPDEFISLCATTLGALPTRRESKPALDAARALSLPEPPTAQEISFESKIPQAAAVVAWKIPGVTDNIDEVRRLNVLAQVLNDRMREKIREELGASYSPYAGVAASEAFPDYGTVQAISVGRPEDATKLGTLIVEIAETLTKEGVSEDEFERAHRPMLAGLEQSLRDNGYWLETVMLRSQEQPQRLDWARERETDYEAITAGELTVLARKYLKSTNALRAAVAPVPPQELP